MSITNCHNVQAGFTSHLQRMRKPVDTQDDTGTDEKKSALTSTDMWGGEPEVPLCALNECLRVCVRACVCACVCVCV